MKGRKATTAGQGKSDYDRIAWIIRYLDGHFTEQPDLTTLASLLGLSESHFHRLFARWAGITPKDFLQCLTLARIRQTLRSGSSVLEASLEAGLSGPGRLHDLSVTIAAASPGELKAGGAGWTIKAGFAQSPFGKCLIAEGERGICHIGYVERRQEMKAWQRLLQEWPNARLQRDDTSAQRLSGQVFTAPLPGKERTILRAFVRGTAFQLRVWQALVQIPPGGLISYSGLATAIGSPGAARAVGSAVGANSIAFLIPCHRVIRETGIVGDYRWGRDRKCAKLVYEQALCRIAR